MTTKNEVIATAIKAVLEENGWSIADIETRTPDKFWVYVVAHIPENLPFKITNTTLSSYLTRNACKQKKAVFAIVRSLYAGYVEEAPQQTQQTQRPQQFTIDDIRRIVSEELDRRLSEVEKVKHNEHNAVELVPEAPVGEGKEKKREYIRFSVTVDKALWKLFRQEQTAHNTTAPRMLDSILWERYGKPKLSFE